MARIPSHDPKLPHGTAYCRCGACGAYFRSDRAFLKHRKGGACLTAAAMLSKGMALGARGYWATEAYTRPTP
jgi:hypothetical protein